MFRKLRQEKEKLLLSLIKVTARLAKWQTMLLKFLRHQNASLRLWLQYLYNCLHTTLQYIEERT